MLLPRSAALTSPVRPARSALASRSGVAARIGLRWPQKVRLTSARRTARRAWYRRSHSGQPVEHAADRGAVDHFFAGAAIPAGDLHRRLVERPREAETAALLPI